MEGREEVEETGVPEVDLGALRQPLLDVGVIGRQAAEDERPLEHVEVMVYGRRGDAERAGEVRHVEDAPVDVGEHGGESPQARGRKADAERREVALQERRDVAVEPVGAGPGAPERVHRRIAAPEPAVSREARRGQLDHREWGQLEQADSARQGLRGGPQEGGARRPGQKKAPLGGRAIEDMAEHREQLRQALGLVEDDVPGVCVEESLGIGADERGVTRALEVEVEPVREEPPDERALPGLARAVDQDRGKRPKEAAEGLCGPARDVPHALYIITSTFDFPVILARLDSRAISRYPGVDQISGHP